MMRMPQANIHQLVQPKFYKRIAAGILAGLIVLAFITPLVRAQTNDEGSFNFVVSPLPVALEAKPGTTASTNLQIKNAGNSTERVKVTVLKFSAEGEDGTPKLLDVGPGDDFINWVTFSESRFDAEPNVFKTIKMNINIPSGAAFGYYYAVIFSRDGAEQNIQPEKANLLGAVASLVLLDVQAPGAKREAALTEYSTPKRTFEFLPADFTVRLKNTGNVHVAPRGNIFIKQGGQTKGLIEVNLNKGYILPGTFRKFTADWRDGNPVYKVKEVDGKVVLDKNGKQKHFLDWSNFNPSKLRMGKFDAKLVMVYNDGTHDVPVEGNVSFWVIPWRILGVFLVILLLLLAGLYALIGRPLRNRFKKKK